MEKLYDRIYWYNNTTPALNASNLNSMSKAIDDIDNRVIQIADEVVDDIADIHQWHDDAYQYKNEAYQSAQNASGYATQASNYATQAGTSATSADGYSKTSEAYAIGKRGGSDVPSSDPAYHNNAKYYAEQAGQTVEHATEGAEAWAVGTRAGVPVPSTDPAYNNNAKYYAEKAEDAVDDCNDIKEEVMDIAGGSNFTVDFATGELRYTNETTYDFSINTTTGNLEWEVVA